MKRKEKKGKEKEKKHFPCFLWIFENFPHILKFQNFY